MKHSFKSVVVLAILSLLVSFATAKEYGLPKRLLTDEIARLGPGPENGDFTFVVMGDTRDGFAMFRYMIELANRMNPAFIVDVGDLVHSGGDNEQYLRYYEDIKRSRVPFFSVIGNHENEAPGGLERYKEMFGEPDFYFDYGGARFIALDNAADGYKITDAQFGWLEKLLQTDKIKFIFMHAPPKTHVWTEAMEREPSERFMKMVEKYKVRKIYFGHVHAFDRLRRGNTDYVMTGCAGGEPDPISNFYHRLAGGYYQFMLVQVRGGQVMDVLVEPSTADIYDFPNADGVPIETPYVTYRHFNTPVIRSFEVDTSVPGNKPIPVKVQATHHPDSLETGLSYVEVECESKSGEKTGPVRLTSDPYDERTWSGELPPLKARPLRCSVRAESSVHSATMNLFPLVSPPAESIENIPFTMVSIDRDDPQVENELDILDIGMAYDDEYFYVRIELAAPPEKGDKTKGIYNLIGFALLDESVEIVADVEKMLTAVPVSVYVPLAPALGMPSCSLFDVSEYKKGEFKPYKKALDCRIVGRILYFRLNRAAAGLKDTRGVKLLAPAGQLLLMPKPDVRIADAANITHIKLGEFKGDPAAPWPYTNLRVVEPE
ncbi:MAG: metallophosphoesterase [bacterium]